MAPKTNPYVKAVTASNPPKAPKPAKPTKKAPAPTAGASASTSTKKAGAAIDADVLRKQIAELGGDEADLKMLLDAGESDSEMEDGGDGKDKPDVSTSQARRAWGVQQERSRVTQDG